jgi:hypothetical protein
MNITERKYCLFQALPQARTSLQPVAASSPQSLPAQPSLSDLLEEFILPEDALLFGVADDGLPVLLNLRRPKPGPILILGDAGSGKTDLLRVVAQSAAWTFHPSRIQFTIVTPTPEGWDGRAAGGMTAYPGRTQAGAALRTNALKPSDWETSTHVAGVHSTYGGALKDVFFYLRAQAGNDSSAPLRLILIDDLAALVRLKEGWLETLRWLLVHGPAHRLWPIVTLNSGLALEIPSWLSVFHTRLFGRVANPDVADTLAASDGIPASALLAGSQFCIRERSQWLSFWLPTLT